MREFWIGVVLIAAVGGLLLLPSITGLTQGVGDSGLFLFLNAVIVILILILIFVVTRNFWKLVGERRRGILGSHLNLKFVAAFVLIALVTTSGLFIVSAFFITQSIDKWFSVQVDRALEESGEVAESYYESTADNAMFYGARIAERDRGRAAAARRRPGRARAARAEQAARVQPRRRRDLRRRTATSS